MEKNLTGLKVRKTVLAVKKGYCSFVFKENTGNREELIGNYSDEIQSLNTQINKAKADSKAKRDVKVKARKETMAKVVCGIKNRGKRIEVSDLFDKDHKSLIINSNIDLINKLEADECVFVLEDKVYLKVRKYKKVDRANENIVYLYTNAKTYYISFKVSR